MDGTLCPLFGPALSGFVFLSLLLTPVGRLFLSNCSLLLVFCGTADLSLLPSLLPGFPEIQNYLDRPLQM